MALGRTHYIQVQLNAANVYVDDTFVPVFLNLADPLFADIFNRCRADGLDIIATAVNGSTAYDRVIISFDQTANTGQIAIKLPAVLAASGATFWLQYGGTNQTADSTNVFRGCYGGAANYDCIYPLEEASGNGIDFSGNNYDLTHTNLAAQGVAAKIGNGCDYEVTALSSRSTNANAGNFERTQPVTISMWFWLESNTQSVMMSRTPGGATFVGWHFSYVPGLNQFRTFLASNIGTGNYIRFDSTWVYDPLVWHKLDITYRGDSDANNMAVYVDGGALVSAVNTNALTASILTATPFQISGYNGANSIFDGKVDLPSVLCAELSANQIRGQYDIQNGFLNGANYNTSFTIGSPVALPMGILESRMGIGIANAIGI